MIEYSHCFILNKFLRYTCTKNHTKNLSCCSYPPCVLFTSLSLFRSTVAAQTLACRAGARGRLIASFRRRSPFLDISGRRKFVRWLEKRCEEETHLKGIRKVSKVKRAATRRCICEFSCRVRVFLKIVIAACARVFIIDASREEIHRTHIYIHVSYIHREHTIHTHTHVHMKIPLPIIATLSLLPLLLLLCYNWLLVEFVWRQAAARTTM